MYFKIPFAKKNAFYSLLNSHEDPECDKIIYGILKFYAENKRYTIGRDFTDALLHAMCKYKPNDIRLNSSILATSYNYAGSNRVAAIAMSCILGFFALIILIFYFDSLVVQTGTQLFQVQRNNTDYKPKNFKFCPVNELDSMLQSLTFVNRFPKDAIHGILQLNQSAVNY